MAEAAAGAVLGVDVGGTFTDAVLVIEGRVFAGKSPSTPSDQSQGVMKAAAEVLAKAEISPGQVSVFAHGMTVATNALLEGRVARTALVATMGFTDIVEIGRQNRPQLYRLEARGPAPLAPPELRFELDERMGPDGVIREPSDVDLRALAEAVAASGAESVAVCLLHADRHPQHELLVGQALRERLDETVHVSLSHQTVGTFREYERAATTEVDAALSPLLSGYLSALVDRSASTGLPVPLIMQSSGGLSDIATVSGHAALAVMSGPAGGAAAAGLVSSLADEPDLLCFDMGGTSCDVCVVEGGAVRESGGSMVGGRPLALPMVDIDTVGAGGGSIAWRDPGGALRVGPGSAGAEPGPACYGKGGTLPTVTDAHLVLGRLGQAPTLASGIVLDRGAALAAVSGLAVELGMEVDACAAGILEVADSEMVRALRVMTVQRGLDPRDFTLLAFGGAGPLHATTIADELSIRRVLVPVTGGVFSALGLAAADRRRDDVRTVMVPGKALDTATLVKMIGDADQVSWDLRYRGQSFELTVTDSSGDPARLRRLFESEHEARYGYSDPGAAIELVTVRRRHIQPGPGIGLPRSELRRTEGPGVIDLGQSTLWVGEGWVATGGRTGVISLERSP